MRVVYIAGPFRALNRWENEEHIRRAERLALEVWRLGVAVICPHTNTRHFDGAADEAVWLDGYIELLSRSDAMMLTPNWATSHGATAEREYPIDHNIPVFDNLNDLRQWLEGTHA